MGEYKLKLNLVNTLIVVIVYSIVLIGMQKISGVPYTDITHSTSNLINLVLIPVAIGSVLITIFSLWSGWWKEVWRDKYQIKNHAWMHVFLILTLFVIICNFLGGNIRSLDLGFILVALIGTILVGYSEELLTRGLLVQGARSSGYSEVKVFLITMVVFGGMHGLNIINGQPIASTMYQIIFAGLLGGILYTIFRKTGFLVVPMMVHALWDFSLLTQGTSQLAQAATTAINSIFLIQLLAAGAAWLSFILLIFAARNFNVRKKQDKKI